jgi:DNA-binding response OmpR family regulator
MEKKKILYVDDEEGWRTVVTTTLSGIGYEVLTAANASEAMRLTDGTSLNLLILDLNLAGESGLTLMKYLRHNQPSVPILVFTGMEHDECTVEAMRALGADQYLHKGSMEDLVATVRSVF